MLDNNKIGKQIALLRKEKGFTGEQLSEILGVSPQAVSKWENGRCLPETAVLPLLAKELGCSIDSLLMPKELLVLTAVYSDGAASFDVTQTVNNLINGNRLSITVCKQFLGVSIESSRLKVLTVKYQNPYGIYYSYAIENEVLELNETTTAFEIDNSFNIIGAYYGNSLDYSSALSKIKHYEYFQWNTISANHENFPSSTAAEDTEFLTIIYINKKGIFTISCDENESISYSKDRRSLYLKDNSYCSLPGICTLEWEKGMDCTWAGAMHAALKYMGEDISYEQVMGLSGACYRLAFANIWDWSAGDALVAYDYSDVLFKAIGYKQEWADRVDKSDRKAERKRIIEDIVNGKPVVAINLRIAPEWGIITGYMENGSRFLCRTYFDKEIFNEHKGEEDFLGETDGYLEADFWPFAIVHFGERTDIPTKKESLLASLNVLVDSYHAPENRGYSQGKDAYIAWIKGLEHEQAWTNYQDKDAVFRMMAVNDYLLINLIDARRCAGIYLNDNCSILDGEAQQQLKEIADCYTLIYEKLNNFRSRIKESCQGTLIQYNGINAMGISTFELRQEQAKLLREIMNLENDNIIKTKKILAAYSK